jgi:L-ascorbate metabolism protein UlaG (beta-lactamase superfamily)
VAAIAMIPIWWLSPSALNLGTGTSDLLVDTDRVTAGLVPCLLVGGLTKAMLKPIDAVRASHHRTTKIGLAIACVVPIGGVLVLSS